MAGRNIADIKLVFFSFTITEKLSEKLKDNAEIYRTTSYETYAEYYYENLFAVYDIMRAHNYFRIYPVN